MIGLDALVALDLGQRLVKDQFREGDRHGRASDRRKLSRKLAFRRRTKSTTAGGDARRRQRSLSLGSSR
jgi:hypothetical protein